MDDYFLELKRGVPIHYGCLSFKPISFKYICDDIGFETFNSLLMPFRVTKSCFMLDGEDCENKDLFKDIILKDEGLLQSLSVALSIFCDCSNIELVNGDSIVITVEDGNTETINSDNFQDIAKIIMYISAKEPIVVETPPKNLSPRRLDIWKKLHEGRQREAQKNEIYIYDILNVCEFCGNYRIPQQELDEMTLWQIMNCYKSKMYMKVYDDNLKICLVSGDNKTISNENYWHSKLMIHGKT